MSKQKHISMTPATQFLKKHRVEYGEHCYDYVEHGGTGETAKQLGVPEHHIIKTLVFEDDGKKPHLVLMHGDAQVSSKNLARQIGVKSIQPALPDIAPKYSGYQLGGTSPFGTRKAMPVWVEKTIFQVERIYINGGKRGYILSMSPHVLETTLGCHRVEVANYG